MKAQDPAVTPAELLQFIRGHKWAVQASVTPDGTPQAALVGFAVTDRLELVFDTLETTRKAFNLHRNGRIALVIGGWTDGDERTVQYEGVADVPGDPELARLKAVYFSVFPEGRERQAWPGLVYFRVTPRWIRFVDHNRSPPRIEETRF